MTRWWYALSIPLFLSCALAAQQVDVAPGIPVDAGTLRQWLHSNDPRLVAWAADSARRTHDDILLSAMPAMLEHVTMQPARDGDVSQAAQRRAILGLLDALIQTNTPVPVAAINAIVPWFPAQAAILLSRQSLSESRQTLEDWTYSADRGWNGRVLARIASMMLAKDPSRSHGIIDGQSVSFVASVVAASEEDLRIAVSANGNMDALSGGGNPCGDSLGRSLAAGWPQVYAYDLVENDRQDPAETIVDLDGDRIASRRFKENQPWGTCNGVQPLNPMNRERLIAHWLGISVTEMSWQPVKVFEIAWTGQVAYQQQLGMIVANERKKLHTTVELLHQRGFLTEEEAATVSPRLTVATECYMTPCPLQVQ